MTHRIALILLLACLLAPAVYAADPRTSIHAEADQVQPLLPGMTAPAFQLKDAAGEPVDFDPTRMQKPLVLTFFRGGWCPFCNLHLAELRKAEGELERLGFDNWFVSMDRPELLYRSLEDPSIRYRVLSDSGLEATRAFGIAFRVSDEVYERYIGYGVDLEEVSGRDHHVLPAPSTFIVGGDGVIRFQYTNPDYSLRLHPDVLLAAARSYLQNEEQRLRARYREQHPEE